MSDSALVYLSGVAVCDGCGRVLPIERRAGRRVYVHPHVDFCANSGHLYAVPMMLKLRDVTEKPHV